VVEGVAEDTDEEMALVVICTRARSSGDAEEILDRQRVKV
jgi:hypothetical protein